MRPVRSAIAALVSASLALGGPTLVPALAWANAPKKVEHKAGPPPIAVKIGQARDLTHIEFPGADPVASRKDGNDLVLRFARGVSTDLTQLKVLPPHFTKPAVITPCASGVEVRLSPADGAVFRMGKADGVTFVNFSAAPDAAPAGPPAPKDQTPVRHADPVPSSGVVRMQPELQGKALALKFPWRAPLGAAVFRRGDALWIVFDAKARIDVSSAPHGLVQLRKVEAVDGKDYSAVRITAPATILASADAQGATWTITLGPSMTAAQGVTLARDDTDGPATLTAQMAGSTGVFWVDDPVVGDRLAVVTALAPAKGLDTRRQMVDAILLPSVQGLAVQPLTEDLAVSADGDLVRIGRPRGLALSPTSAPMRHPAVAAAADVELPAAAALPGLIDFTNWPKTGEGGFIKRYAQLMDAAADEGGKGKAAGVQARMGLARFQIGSGLAFEAIGTLNLLARTNPSMLGDAEFRGLRGAARAMAGRYHDAQADFSSPVVADDPASALWRGYASAKLGDYAGAREQFGRGRSALNQFSGEWRARFARVDAEAALALGDLGTARGELNLAAGERVGDDEADAIRLAQGRLAEAQNQTDQALALYEQVGKSHYGAVAAPALLRAAELKLAKGKLSPADAVAQLDSLRFRWRGDGTELETVRALGHLYLNQGRYREALEAMRSAGQRQPDQQASLAVASDLQTAFRALFLDGQADGLQPLQAVALFFDFKQLTPIGADGDLMVRKMVRRLVDVDLLDQAADLLKYQVDERLNGVPKAQVSTDLATIYLMDKKPEQALQAINNSRSTLLPAALNAQRRVVEARALLALGRGDHALELLEGDKSPEAADVRAQASWSQHAWPQAGAQLEGQLGDRWKRPDPLTGDEQARLMRAGVAYSLAGDDAGLARLRTRYGKLAETSGAPDGLRVALAGVQENSLNASDFAKAASDTAAFAGWVAAMKKRFHDQQSAAPPPPAAAQPKLTKAAAPTSKPPVKPSVRKG
jgi:tetratricopeptide (TPR) repeat protein